MTFLIPWVLLVHLPGVMIGLGPTFVFARITGEGARAPEHARFTTTMVRALSSQWSHPLALTVFLSGAALTWLSGYDLLATRWLLVSIILFLPSFVYAALVQNKDLGRILELTANGPAGLNPEQSAELGRRRRRARRGGQYMRLTALVILVLMVLKPF